MRRDSWRSVPMMWSPPSATTRSCSGKVAFLASSSAACLASAGAVAGSSPFFDRIALARKSGLPPSRMSVPRPAMLVAMVTRALATGLRHDLGLALVVLRVQHLMGDAAPLEELGEPLGLLDRHGPDQHGLPLAVALHDLVRDRVELLPLGLVHDVGVIERGSAPGSSGMTVTSSL